MFKAMNTYYIFKVETLMNVLQNGSKVAFAALLLSSIANAGFTDTVKAGLTTAKEKTQAAFAVAKDKANQGWTSLKEYAGPVQRDEETKAKMRCEKGLMTEKELQEKQDALAKLRNRHEELKNATREAKVQKCAECERNINDIQEEIDRTTSKQWYKPAANRINGLCIEHPSYVKYGVAATITAAVTTATTLAIKYRKHIKNKVASLISKISKK
jgi:hypothetical protein